MTDAQQVFDYARRQFDALADDIEKHFESVAGQIRAWIPPDSPFVRPPPPPKRLPPPTMLQAAQRWMLRHRALTAAAVAFIVTGSIGAVVYAQNQQSRKKSKRRAKRSANGARTEVVVVAGAVANPIASALYLDLERRGYVVYVVANTSEDEQYIRAQSRIDLLPLTLDLVDPFTAQEQLARFKNLLEREHSAFDGADPHRLNFAGLVLVPDTQSTPAKVEDISSEEWSDALNAKVLNIIATTKLFLPSVIERKAKVLLLTPSVTPALKLPGHAVESTVYGALQGFTSSLAAELRQEGITLSHFKLGNIDIPSISAKQKREGIPQSRFKATPLRQLNDAVFDALASTKPRRTWHIGRGSLAYDVIGSWLPPSAIAWMMGAGRKPAIVEEVKEEEMRSSAGSLTWERIEQDA
jgi:NAD(P)-dependent dehydrogenase (short-subunit alcohol dehydrogenase family)